MTSVHKAMKPAPILINTRPDERATALSDYLSARGIDAVAMPLLALTPCAVNDTARAYMRAWVAGDYDALVVISPTAAEYGLAEMTNLLSESNHLKPSKGFGAIIAVGKRTLSELQKAPQLQTATLSIPAISNNEGLIAMPELASLQAGARVLIWRGHGGRRLLVEDLQARGIQVDSIAWYARTLPVAAQQQYHAWHMAYLERLARQPTTDKPWVLISSGAAWIHWVQIVTLPLTDFRYIVLGARLSAVLHQEGLSYVTVDELAPAHVYQAMQSTIR